MFIYSDRVTFIQIFTSLLESYSYRHNSCWDTLLSFCACRFWAGTCERAWSLLKIACSWFVFPMVVFSKRLLFLCILIIIYSSYLSCRREQIPAPIYRSMSHPLCTNAKATSAYLSTSVLNNFTTLFLSSYIAYWFQLNVSQLYCSLLDAITTFFFHSYNCPTGINKVSSPN